MGKLNMGKGVKKSAPKAAPKKRGRPPKKKDS